MTGEQIAVAAVLTWLLGSVALTRIAWFSHRRATRFLRSVDKAVGPDSAKALRRGTAPMYVVVETMKEDPVGIAPFTWRIRRFPSPGDIGKTRSPSVLRLYEQELRLRRMLANVLPVVCLSLYGLVLSLAVGPWWDAIMRLWHAKAGSEWGAMLLHLAASLVTVGAPLAAVVVPLWGSASAWRYRRRVDMLSDRIKETIRLRLEEARFSE